MSRGLIVVLSCIASFVFCGLWVWLSGADLFEIAFSRSVNCMFFWMLQGFFTITFYVFTVDEVIR